MSHDTLVAMPTDARTKARAAATFTLVGGVFLVAGALFHFGHPAADMWAALREDRMAEYLATVGEAPFSTMAKLTLWMIGVIPMAIGIHTMAEFGRHPMLTRIAQMAVLIGSSVVLLAYLAIMSLTVQIAPDTSPTSVAIAEVVGWVGARGDDVATAVLAGLVPPAISLAGREDWVPRWLFVWGIASGVLAAISIVVLYVPPIAFIGILIVPVGLFWWIAAAFVLLHQTRSRGHAG